MQILYWFENTEEPMSENSYLRQIHSIIYFIHKSYLFTQAKKQNCGVFWKISVLREL